MRVLRSGINKAQIFFINGKNILILGTTINCLQRLL